MATSFNEAPIHESGKYAFSMWIHTDSVRFNEAPIHESGKSTPRQLTLGGVDMASMRPRFMNRGSTGPPGQPGTGILASMRPRFMNRGSAAW